MIKRSKFKMIFAENCSNITHACQTTTTLCTKLLYGSKDYIVHKLHWLLGTHRRWSQQTSFNTWKNTCRCSWIHSTDLQNWHRWLAPFSASFCELLGDTRSSFALMANCMYLSSTAQLGNQPEWTTSCQTSLWVGLAVNMKTIKG